MERNARFMENMEEQKEPNSVVQSLDPTYCHLKKRFLHPALNLFRDSILCNYLQVFFPNSHSFEERTKCWLPTHSTYLLANILADIIPKFYIECFLTPRILPSVLWCSFKRPSYSKIKCSKETRVRALQAEGTNLIFCFLGDGALKDCS